MDSDTSREPQCPVCGAVVGTSEFCPCCEQWQEGFDTRGIRRWTFDELRAEVQHLRSRLEGIIENHHLWDGS